MCNLIITRKKQIVASLASCNIIIDDIDYGAIKNGSVLQCSLNDGNHEITLKWWRKRKKSVFSVYIPSDMDTVHINVNFSKSKEEFTLVSNDIKIANCLCNVNEDNYIVEQNPLHMQISPEEKLQRLIVEAPHISLNEGEVCYYCNTASAIHQKNVVTGRTSGGAGVSFRVAKGVSIRTGGGNSQVIRENVNEYFEGTLYITNIRIILLAPKHGFDLYISKITQLLYKDFGLEIFSGSKCYQVLTADRDNIQELVELMNSQRVFKNEKWLREHYNHMNSTPGITTTKTCDESKNNAISANFDNLDGLAFENWCATLLRNNGFVNVEVTKSSGDQGVDVLAEKGEIKYAIQCKCYSSDLGNSPVQEVHAGKSMYNCHVGVVMTNRHFTSGAKELAKATGVLLWDREKLLQMMSNQEEPISSITWNDLDENFLDAVIIAVESGQISTSLLQRRLNIGYGRASQLIDKMVEMGILSEPDGVKPRKVLMSKDDVMEKIIK